MSCKCETLEIIGQVPGQIYDGRVLDENGNGLYAGFFFLDKDGKPITEEATTDAAGYFHYTVPLYNHQNIFVQFYATEEFEPIVKSFDELVNVPTVVLIKKEKKAASNLLLIGGAAALGLLAAHNTKNKKISGVQDHVNRARANPLPYMAGALVLIGGLWYIFKYKPKPEQKEFLAAAKKRLEYLAKELGIVPSLSIATFTALAMQINRAIDKCGTDEAAIYRAFDALNNEADFWFLCIQFGISKYDGCFEGSLPSWNVHYTLPEALSSDLSGNQFQTVLAILRNKNINIAM